MILRPALRFLTGPFPPGVSAARALAAVILPPLLFFAIFEFTSLIPFFPLVIYQISGDTHLPVDLDLRRLWVCQEVCYNPVGLGGSQSDQF